MKDFVTWSTQKKSVHGGGVNKWCNERDIWWCVLGVNVGYEQDGKGKKFLRPVIILRNFGIFTALIVPLTTSSKKSRYLFPLGKPLGRDASAIITQIRLVDTRRLIEKASKLDKKMFEEIKQTVKALL